jgi:hypothetical protein
LLKSFQYLLYGTLRAFPNQQYRKLCIALQDNNLPINRDEVHVLLKTVLYHVGDFFLNEHETFSLAWKGDIFTVVNDSFKWLEHDLYRSLRIIIEIASYASQWSQECRRFSILISEIVFKWAN